MTRMLRHTLAILLAVPLTLAATGMPVGAALDSASAADAAKATAALADDSSGPPAAEHNCRFWACVSDAIPDFVVSGHLTLLPNSIRNLSRSNVNGWSVATYGAGEAAPLIRRGVPAAWQDAAFDAAVAEAAARSPQIAVSHIRACSSGLCGIPNPHPFERIKNGKHWLMGHNGTISKQVLINLIRSDYLEANPPEYGASYSEWIDTELYFILMLQTIEDHAWDVKSAIGEVIGRLRDAIVGDGEMLNFFLTDGTTLWAYRQGHSLYYTCDPAASRARRASGAPRQEILGTPYSAVASQFPSAEQGSWIEMADGEMVTLSVFGPPQVEAIEAYFPAAAGAQR